MRAAALLIALASIAAGLLTPIYTDEIAWRLHERGWIDGVDRGLAVTCMSAFFAEPPAFMWPVRIFSAEAALAWQHPLSVRLAGVACFAAWLWALWRIIGTTMPAQQADRFRLIAVSAMSLGVLPFAMAMSRPEQPLLLALTTAVLIVVSAGKLTSRFASVGALAAVAVLAAIGLSYHPKAAVYAPLFLLAVPFAGTARIPVLRTIAFLAIALMIAVASAYWRGRLQCPEDPILTASLAKENLLSGLFSGAPVGGLIADMVRLAWPGAYIQGITPWSIHMSDWLPRHMVDRSVVPWIITIRICWVALIGSTIFVLAIRLVKDRLAVLQEPNFLFAAAIVGTVIGWSALQVNKNSYESALALPMLVLAFALAFSDQSATRDGARAEEIQRVAAWLAAIASAISLVCLCVFYMPTMYERARAPGYTPAQIFSTSVFNYPTARNWVEDASRQCGIPTDGTARGVLIDDLTYFSFVSTPALHYRTAFFRTWQGSLDDPAAWLLEHGSAGIVNRCDEMPLGLRRHAVSVGPICCLNREMLTRAVGNPERRLKP